MIDASYFEKRFLQQIEEMGTGSVSAILRLRCGEEMAIERVVRVEEQYLVAKIFPMEAEPGDKKSQNHARDARRKTEDGEVFYDQVAVGYEEIAFVRLTITSAEERRRIGFTA